MALKPDIVKTNPVHSHILDFAIALIILLLGWVYTHGIEQFLDISLYDESNYLYWGITIPRGFPQADLSPIYALWYYLLSFLRHDTIELYFLNYKAMSVLPALMFFLALRTNSVSRALSFVLTMGFIFSSANFPTLPKVSHFAVLILLFGFFVSNLFRDRKYITCILLIAVLFVSYVRPELFISFFLLGLLLAFLSFSSFRKSYSLNSVIPFGVTLIISIILILSFGLPIGSGSRGMTAFGQHYSLNWVSWHKDNRSPWTNWKTIVEADFGNIDSPGEALLRNPSAVAHHIFQNLQTFPREIISMYGSLYPKTLSTTSVAFKLGLLVLIVAGLAYLKKQRIKESVNQIIQNYNHLRFHLLLVLIILFPVTVSILVIFPRHHYIYIFGSILAFGFSILLFRNKDQLPRFLSYKIMVLVAILAILLTRPLSGSVSSKNQPNLKTIKFLRSLDIHLPINILEAEGGYGIYVGSNYNRIDQRDKKTPFLTFLTDRSINMIVVSDGLSRDIRFSGDQQWYSLINDPAKYGFISLDIPDVKGRSIIVKKDLIRARK